MAEWSSAGVVVDYGERTDPGLEPSKQINEDCCGGAATGLGLLAVLCDGMGGHEAGERASRAALDTIVQRISGAQASAEPQSELTRAIESANRAVYALGGQAPQGVRPGSTVVVALLSGNQLVCAHVGDSRAYLTRAGYAHRLTRDHSVVEELLQTGALHPDQAAAHPDAHHITRALGMSPDIDVTVSAAIEIDVDDVVLLCSDGLTDLVQDEEIAHVLTEAQSAESASRALVALANQRGGHDNITVQVLRILKCQGSRAPGEPERPMSRTLRATPKRRPEGQATEAWTPEEPQPTVTDTQPLPAAGDTVTAPVLAGPRASTPSLTPEQRRAAALDFARGRLLFWVGVGVMVAIVLGIVFWALARA
jgi:serine/threonine protein phosphatase PrpC